MKRLTVNEAAESLEISKEAVRKRMQRGTLPHTKGADGRVYVYLNADTDPSKDVEAKQEPHNLTGQQKPRPLLNLIRRALTIIMAIILVSGVLFLYRYGGMVYDMMFPPYYGNLFGRYTIVDGLLPFLEGFFGSLWEKDVDLRYPSIPFSERAYALLGLYVRYLLAAVGVVTIVALIRFGYRYEWTGFGESTDPKRDGGDVRPKKTLWDWMALLFVPIVLTVLGLALTWAQQTHQLSIETHRAREAALQGYFSDVSALMLKQGLAESQAQEPPSTVARARTLSVLQTLDISDEVPPLGGYNLRNSRTLRIQELDRKNSVVRFLYEADLIKGQEPIISLDGANLNFSALGGANLSRANFHNVNLQGAQLFFADLEEADLTDASLSDAFLLGTDLTNANLSDAVLSSDLSEGELYSSAAYLYAADLHGAKLVGTVLEGVDLGDADLTDADLTNASLIDADLTDADLTNANLTNANLTNANLEGANGTSEKRLERQTRVLEGATMPNGSKHP
jgi:uncharacterized protein YjbI with pentapeptide repeats